MTTNNYSKIKIPSTGSLQLDLGLFMFFVIVFALLIRVSMVIGDLSYMNKFESSIFLNAIL